MGYGQTGPCNVPLTQISGTGFNTVAVPATQGAQYKSITEQLLYEIWQSLLILIAGQTPPGMAAPIVFTIGDGQSFTPAAGTTSFHQSVVNGVNLGDKLLLVQRNGITVDYSTPATANQIIRFNDHTIGGFDFDPASGLTFQNGERYSLWLAGIDTTIAP